VDKYVEIDPGASVVVSVTTDPLMVEVSTIVDGWTVEVRTDVKPG